MKKLFLKKDNSGAAMLTVVIAILFIVALGVALLTASYMGFAVTLAQKNGQANFYNANAAMDDVRAYIHTQASDALASAYTETLKNYAVNSKTDSYDVQADFSQKFVAALQKSGTGLMTGSGSTYYVNLTALQNQLSAPQGGTVSLTAADGGPVTLSSTGSGSNLTYTAVSLKGLSLSYTNAKNFQDTVSTDIAINVPSFNVTSSVPHSLKEFSIVANTALDATATGASVAGNVYAGKVGVSGGGNITFSSGDLLCGGDIAVSGDSSALTFAGDPDGKIRHEIWAKNIVLTGGSEGNSNKFTISDANTRTYVKNDLSLNGSSNAVTLLGEYTGFGGDTASKGASADKDNSSAILIGGKNAELNISGLSKLTLAGVSFINPTSATVTTPIPMGQSVAVKTDQLAYLVPVSCLSNAYPTNPYYYTGSSAPTLKVYTDTALWPNSADTTLSAKTIVDYLGQPVSNGSLTFAKGRVDARYSNVGGGGTQHIAYAFFIFTDQDAANAYFRDYCKANPQNISQYLGYYLSDSSLVLPGSVSTAGTTYSSTGAGASPSPNDASDVSAAGPADLFATAKSISPYSSFVGKKDAIQSTYKFYDTDNNLVAVVTNDDNYSFSGTDTTLRVIVSTNGVTIPEGSTFSGVIIAYGTVTVRGSVAQPSDVDWQKWLAAKTTDGKYSLSDFLGNGGTSGGSSANNWDLSDLVVYENWKKS